MPAEPVVLPVSGRAHLHLSTRSGRVTITAEERSDIEIDSDAPLRDKIDVDDSGRVTVKSARGGSGRLEVRCPTGADVSVGTVSGSVELRGQFEAVRATTVSGSITLDRAAMADIRSVAGNIDVGHCEGRCRLQTKSGRVVCGTVGEAQVSTLSGRIKLGGARKVLAQSASGKIDVGMQGKGDVAVQTMSGAVRVEVPAGVKPNFRLRSLSGKPRCDCEKGEDCEIRVRSLSGKIEVVPST